MRIGGFMTLLSFLNKFLELISPIFQNIPGFREAISFLLVFFLPGFCWTLFLFDGRQINRIERVALSIGLSISLVTLTIFAMNRLGGVRITGLSSVSAILLLALAGLILYGIKKSIMRDYRTKNKSYSGMKE